MDHKTFEGKLKIGIVFTIIVAGISLFSSVQLFAADVVLDGRVLGCGDGVVESGESCDGVALNAQSCTTLGFSGGALACTPTCIFDTSACTISSGGGGGGGSQTNSARSLVAFEGQSMPFGVVTLRIDGEPVASTTSDQLGHFSFTAKNLSRGTYRFELFAVDPKGIQTNTVSFNTAVKDRSVLKFDTIVLSPTLASNLSTAVRGGPVSLSGYGAPNMNLLITSLDSALATTFYTVHTDQSGAYIYTLTAPLSYGQLTLTTRAVGATSTVSRPITLVVGDANVSRGNEGNCPAKADLNADCRVNLIDFSILIFWYRETISDAFRTTEKAMLSGDGKADFTDFSVMMYHWTG